MSNPLKQYSEHRLEDAANRLEGFRCAIGQGELNEDLQVAIDCLEYFRDAMKYNQEAPAVDRTKKPHWIIVDHGFAGMYHKCSECGKGRWDVPKGDVLNCPHCHVALDPNEIEYGF